MIFSCQANKKYANYIDPDVFVTIKWMAQNISEKYICIDPYNKVLWLVTLFLLCWFREWPRSPSWLKMWHIFLQISYKPNCAFGQEGSLWKLEEWHSVWLCLAQKVFSFLSFRTKPQMGKAMAFLKIDCRWGVKGQEKQVDKASDS